MATPWPIEVAALTPAACGSVVWRMGGADHVTVIAKATFALVKEGVAQPFSPKALVRADRHLDRGQSVGSLRHASELAPYLPCAGVVLVGHAYALGATPTDAISVRLEIARERSLLEKTVHVYGDRPYDGATPAPFQKIPLIFERAYGGPGVEDNPLGVGAAPGSAPPNLLDPKDPTKPACFTPIPARWAARRRLLGGAEPPRLDGIATLPEGFDWMYMCAAPPDQRLDYLQGDEWITLEGVSRVVPRLHTRLPGARAQARWWIEAPAGDGAPTPIEMLADTLVIDADNQTCSVVWRGSFVVDPAALPHVRAHAGVELPNEPIPWPDELEPFSRTRLGAAMPAKPALPFSPSPPAGAKRLTAPPPAQSDDPMGDETAPVNRSAVRKAALPFASAAAPQPRTSPPPKSPPVAPAAPSPPAADDDSAELFGRTASVDLLVLQRSALPFSKGSEPQAPGAPALTTGLPFFATAGEPPVQPPAAAPAFVPPPAWRASAPEEPARPPEPPAPALLESFVDDEPDPLTRPPPKESPAPVPAIPPAPPLPEEPISEARRRAIELLAAKGAFDDQDFAGADLHGLDFSNRSLVRVNLRGADLRGSRFEGAKLAGAELAGADLSGARLAGADLSSADLSAALLVEARLERAKLQRARGEGADLRRANLTGADLRWTKLARASFEGATLLDARIDAADLSNARLVHADLQRACLRGARLVEAVLAHANLEAADLRAADLERANVHGASRRSAKTAGANLKDLVDTPPEGDREGR